MPDGTTINTPDIDLEADAKWSKFRKANFIRTGPDMAWVWASSDEFDFVSIGMHLKERPGFRVDVGSLAMAIIEDSDVLVVPLVCLTQGSIGALQPHVSFDIRDRVNEIRQEQNETAVTISSAVQAKFASQLHPAPAQTQ